MRRPQAVSALDRIVERGPVRHFPFFCPSLVMPEECWDTQEVHDA